MNRSEYIEECEKQLLGSTFYEKIDESNLQKQNTKFKKRNYEPRSK